MVPRSQSASTNTQLPSLDSAALLQPYVPVVETTDRADDILLYQGSQAPSLTIAIGAAYGTAKAGISIAGVGTFKPELIMKVPSLSPVIPTTNPSQSLIPVVMSGIIAVYGLVMAVLIAGSLNPLDDYSLYKYTLSRPPETALFCILFSRDVLREPRFTQLTRQWNNTSILGTVRGLDGSGSGLLYRHCRRPGRAELSFAAEGFCGVGADIDFCRGVGVVWVDCGVDLEYESWACAVLETFSQSRVVV
jgi:ATP synthase proteolipid subunit